MLKKFWNDESGQGMVEYVLIIALVAVAAVGAFSALQGGITSKLNSVSTQLGNPVSGD